MSRSITDITDHIKFHEIRDEARRCIEIRATLDIPPLAQSIRLDEHTPDFPRAKRHAMRQCARDLVYHLMRPLIEDIQTLRNRCAGGVSRDDLLDGFNQILESMGAITSPHRVGPGTKYHEFLAHLEGKVIEEVGIPLHVLESMKSMMPTKLEHGIRKEKPPPEKSTAKLVPKKSDGSK